MKEALTRWIRDVDALNYTRKFDLSEPDDLNYLVARQDDYYISLVGELFTCIKNPYPQPADWAYLGNALLNAGGVLRKDTESDESFGILASECALFAAAAFYFGGYSASAYLTLKTATGRGVSPLQEDCFNLLSRSEVRSRLVNDLVTSVEKNNLGFISKVVEWAKTQTSHDLNIGPDEWVASQLFLKIVERFEKTNVRAVLPDGENTFWDRMVSSLVGRSPAVWDFFPSQIDAISGGLLDSSTTFSLQMPTGSGKTALSETLLYYHLNKNPEDVAIMLVPYRSLASELRNSLVKRLNTMGLSARCAYGGTVPTGDEIGELGDTRAIIATPESLSGLLTANPEFFDRVKLVICDEGHLLDGGGRGIGLELLLSRMKVRTCGAPRFVFVSAIVPNIEEINEWLGGTEKTVIRSDFRPALAEFACLSPQGVEIHTQCPRSIDAQRPQVSEKHHRLH